MEIALAKAAQQGVADRPRFAAIAARARRLNARILRPMHHIVSFEELDEIMSDLHDCPFDFDRATFDHANGTWTGMFLRPLWEDPRAEHRGLSLLFVRSRLPVAEATLRVAGIQDVEVIDDQGIGRYTLNEVERTSDGLRFRFNEAMRIDLQLAGSIDATYEEQYLPGIRAIYRQFLLVQSGPVIEKVGGD